MSKNDTPGGAAVQARWRADAEALPRESRQAFLNAVWSGKTIGEAQQLAGITFEEALGTIDMNISRSAYVTLNKDAV
jgi:hypothetical protein